MTPEQIAEAYRIKLASNPDGEIAVDTVEIYHPSLSKTYYLVADNQDLTANIESGALITFEKANMKPNNAANNDDLSQTASFTIADVDNILNDEMQRIPLENETPVLFRFRRYLLSDTTYPAVTALEYEAQKITQSKGLFTAYVGAPSLNDKGTGLILTPDNVPLLRGILA